MLSVGFFYYAECRYAECHIAECRNAECRFAECRGAKGPGFKNYFWFNGTTCFYTFLLNREGATEKVSHFIMLLNPVCNKNLCFYEQKCSLNTAERLKQ